MADRPIPTIGRNVHFQTYGTPGGEFPSQTCAAIITHVYPDDEPDKGDMVDLKVIYRNGDSYKTFVNRADEPTPGCWNWPPRV
ncbi:putative bacteriophage protein [Nocardia nova SH22a]|uniref:Putative bacteriophage protein n=1 Tax=Nocardia nova SH22a TaxID=1415166 RepID=W5TNL1_9NOCA|nr:hypothetical protein [Nocardia nova]AHH20837.1 putative bacteriophage protein [Nocardia nova SH22a]